MVGTNVEAMTTMRTTRRWVLWAAPLTALAPALLDVPPAVALVEPTYLPLDAIDLTMLLPAPPAADSEALRDDIDTVIAIQTAASPARREQAVLDAEVSPQRFVGDLLGPNFTPANAPKTFALLRRVAQEGAVLSRKAKARWARPRPFVVDPRIPVLTARRPNNPAYPSGHTIFAYEMAIVLGAMVPAKRDELLARAAAYGRSRIIVGVHFQTDIDTGRIAGTAIAAMLLESARFQPDLAAATAELRQALGEASAKGGPATNEKP